MTDLSPNAQKVLDAFDLVSGVYYDDSVGVCVPDIRKQLADALRATADQVVPDEPAPTGMRPTGEVYSYREIRRKQRQETRSQLIAIADELEALYCPRFLWLTQRVTQRR